MTVLLNTIKIILSILKKFIAKYIILFLNR